MNDIWSMLGIEPTDDKKAIRRAFAAQSRLHHPEEEPAYFAALNQAYKEALEYGAGAEKKTLSTDTFAQRTTDTAQKCGDSAHFSPNGWTAGAREEEEVKGEETLKEKTSDEKALKEKHPDEKAPNEEAPEGKKPGEEAPEEADHPEGSLLERLDRAAQQAIEKSMETGALHDFILLFENPRQANQADTWKRFFLSESFLGEQFSEDFGKGLLAYLSGQSVCPGDNLPMALLQELAIAYAFIPHFAGEEYFEGLKYPKEWYKVSVEDTFPARRYAAEIFNMQGRECDLKSMTNRILRQPANKVRHNAFSDYLAVKEMSREGRLTEGEKETWQQILGACHTNYLYERNGKQRTVGYYESRSASVVRLYVQWLKDEQVPGEVLLFLYKKLDFKELERSSTRGLYGDLKGEVLRQCPRAEEILFGEEGKQRIVKLYKTYASIINANQTNYDKFIYGETPEIRDRALAFFALPEWEKLKGEKELFERIYSASKRIVMPRTVAETLIGHLSEGDFPEPERTELTESLLRSLSTEKMCRELDYRYEISMSSTAPANIGDNPDFWQYFLMRGFGSRHVKIRGKWEENYIYTQDSECFLPAYINYIYAPSRAWQRRFVGFDEEREEIRNPVSVVCPMPGNRRLRVEFHYHYCLYFVGGCGDNFAGDFAGEHGNGRGDDSAPVLTFSQLQEYAEGLEKPEEFFFLLAVTSIEDSDRNDARTLIETWLKRIPVHPFIIPVIARMLAADNDRVPAITRLPSADNDHVPAAVQSSGEIFHTEQLIHGSTHAGTADGGVESVLYSEQERFCFRAVVSESGFSIWRQMDYGWQDIIFRSAEPGWRKWEEYTWEEYRQSRKAQNQTEENINTQDGRKKTALNALHNLRQPRPKVRAAYSLEGMDMVQKAAQILEAMDGLEDMEGYCVLRYGAKKEKRHDRVFYGARAPFGFDLKAHSPAHVRSRDYLMASSNTKIKEPKILAGRFGWGFKYAPRSDFGPMYVYQGESGKFYAYGAVRMYRADSLEQLLADFFRTEWEGVTEVEVYEGLLTVSRLDHRLEYCYTQEDMRQSMHSLDDTTADKFTLFGGYEMYVEFARWMDGILDSQLPPWVNAVSVGLDWEMGGILTFVGFHEDYACAGAEEVEDGEEREDRENELYLPQAPLLVWAKGMDRMDRADSLRNAMQWYVDCGRFAGKTGGRSIRVYC